MEGSSVTISEFLNQYGVLIALGLIVILLVIITVQLRHRTRPTLQADEAGAAFERALQVLGETTGHYADVSAVLAMVRQIDEMDEDAVRLLESYPDSVRAAAWLHYINNLGAALQAEQDNLRRNFQVYGNGMGVEERIRELRSKLDDAIAQSRQTGSLRTI